MPKDTFFNLPEEKRELIIHTALEEFALHSFKAASVSKIVETLGIAKGSIYQYFDNKLELYHFIINWTAEVKLRAITEAIQGIEGTFFDRFKALIIAGSWFDLSHPFHAQLLINAGRDMEETSKLMVSGAVQFFLPFIEAGLAAGEIRKDIDPLFTAHTCNGLTYSLKQYLEQRYNFSLYELLQHNSLELDTAFPFDHTALEKAAGRLTTFLREGIGA